MRGEIEEEEVLHSFLRSSNIFSSGLTSLSANFGISGLHRIDCS